MSKSLDELIFLEKDARNFGFDWPNKETIIDQAISECEEIRDALHKKESLERVQEEIGDLLHTAISLCLFACFDVEETLKKTCEKFSSRMSKLKEETHKNDLKDLKGQSVEFSLSLWEKIKKL